MAEHVATEPEDQDEALPELFWKVAAKLRHQSRKAFAPWDISPSQSRAMGVLMRHGVMRLSELSDHLRIAARSATEVVDAVEERGLVKREPDPNDRRATLVSLTDEGDRVGHAIRAARDADAERFFGVLDQNDREHLAQILGQLLR